MATLLLAASPAAAPGPLDLRAHGVIVPTARAGRLLREALVRSARDAGRGLLPPRIETPEVFLLSRLDTTRQVGDLERELIWDRVFREADATRLATLFPDARLLLDGTRRRRVAQLVRQLRRTLAEGGHTLATVAAFLGNRPAEAARWQQLALLEEAYLAQLRTLRREDPEDQRRLLAENPPADAFPKEIWLAALPDPQPLFLRALGHRPPDARLRVCLLAEPAQADSFDEWGRPRKEVWTEHPPAPAFPQGGPHLLRHPRAAAAHAAASLAHLGEQSEALALALGSPELAPTFADVLGKAGFAVFNPEGTSLRETAFADLLDAARDFLLTDRFTAFLRLVRHPWVWDRGAARHGPEFLRHRLVFLETFARDHLPATLGAALALAEHHASPDERRFLTDWSTRRSALLTPGDAFAKVREWIAWLGTEASRTAVAHPAEQAALEAFAADLEELEACPLGEELRAGEIFEITLPRLAQRRHRGERQPGEHELLGWLELLWEPRPLLQIHGLNAGWIPRRTGTADPFLPGSLRAELGLPAPADEEAVDTYRLWVLAARRQAHGQLDAIALAEDDQGKPLRPAGLLFTCPDDALPARVEALFRELPPTSANLPWTADFRLRIPPPEPPERPALSVTQFRSYLACPFRFYLRFRLGMDRRPPPGAEFDARAFGTFAHSALERLARDPAASTLTDEAAIRDFLDAAVLEEAVLQVGTRELAAPLLLQIQSVRERLRSAAGHIAHGRQEGWVPRHVEWKLHEAADLRLGDTALRGVIDLIEENEATGAWRIVDYKTSDTANGPAAEHLVGYRRGAESHITAALFDRAGKPHRWKDLQLPLYAWAVRETLGLDLPQVGYFALPKAATDSGWSPWTDFDENDLAAALRCATEIAHHIEAGRFWPPRPRVDYDDFAQLFEPGIEAVIDPTALLPTAFPDNIHETGF